MDDTDGTSKKHFPSLLLLPSRLSHGAQTTLCGQLASSRAVQQPSKCLSAQNSCQAQPRPPLSPLSLLPPLPQSMLTQVESCPGNYPPTLRATGLEERDTAWSPFSFDHGAALVPVGFSVFSPRADAPGMGGQDGGRQETATKFSSHKSQGQPQDAASAIICRWFLHLAPYRGYALPGTIAMSLSSLESGRDTHSPVAPSRKERRGQVGGRRRCVSWRAAWAA